MVNNFQAMKATAIIWELIYR